MEGLETAKKIATKRSYETGAVMQVDKHSRTVRVNIDGGGFQWIPVIDDSYVPRVGHRVQIAMNGDLPVGAQPPTGPDASVLLNPDGALVGPNLLERPGDDPTFEDASAGVGTFDPGASTAISVTAAQAHGGTKSLLVERTGSTGDAVARIPFADAPKAVAGKYYNLVVWARGATSRTKRLDIEFYDGNGQLLQAFIGPQQSVGTTWTELWMGGIAPRDTAVIVPVLHGSVLATAPVGEDQYFDDIFLGEAVLGCATAGAKAWLFDTTVEGWTNVTWTDQGPLSGDGCVYTGSSLSYSPQPGTEPCIGGKSRHTAFAFVEPWEGNGTERYADLHLDWWDAGGNYMSTAYSSAKLVKNGVWTELVVPETLAPVGAVTMSTTVHFPTVGAGQAWRIDTVAITGPSILRIRKNTNPTYIQSGDDASIECRALSTGVATIQFPEGLNGDLSTCIPVIEGDSWRVSCDFINEVTNTVLRNVAVVATWYDSSGQFIGIELHQTPIGSNPGTGWQQTVETFKIPEGVAGMRARVVWLPGAVGEAMYIANVIAQRVPDSDAAVLPRGPVYALDVGASYSDVGIGSHANADGWVMSDWFLVMQNPGVPISVEATFSGTSQADAGFDYEQFRVGITFDGGVTWTYGQEVWTKTDFGYIDICTGIAKHIKTDLPVGNVYCWYENLVYGFHTAHSWGRLSWRTNPA